MPKPICKVKHFIRLYTDYENNPELYQDKEVDSRTIVLTNFSATHYLFYDVLTYIKLSKPYNFSKLKKL